MSPWGCASQSIVALNGFPGTVRLQEGQCQGRGEERRSREVDPVAAPVVKEMFENSLRSNELKENCRELKDRGITNLGRRWYKGGLRYLLTNEAYTGTSVWGRISKGKKAQDPVCADGAWPALVSRELLDAVQEETRASAPTLRKPGIVGSIFLLSGVLKCAVCSRSFIGQACKRGQFAVQGSNPLV